MNRVDTTLQRLNPEQFKAATSTNNCILCIAGAGSGKTSVLTSRIGNLQINERVGTSNMLCLTFTRLAAKEMKERVASLIGDEFAKRLTAGTFHSFCMKVLREYGQSVSLDSDFSIYDENDKRALIETVIKDLRYSSKLRASQIAPWKARDLLTAEEQVVCDEYHYRLKQNNATDLDGLLEMTVSLMRNDESIVQWLRDQYLYVFVDEYQDTDARQESILSMLNPQNLFVVGDPSQNIYQWRGAQIENILSFEDRHPGCEVIRLERNYRSTIPIIEAANLTIEQSPYQSPLQLITDKPGERIECHEVLDDAVEAQMITREIVEVSSPYQDIAVLCRTNGQINLVKTALEDSGIPTFVVSNKGDPLNLYDIRRVLDYMSFISNPKNELSINRIINWPERRIGDIALLRADPDDVASLALPELTSLKELKETIKNLPCWDSALEMWKELVNALGLNEMYQKSGLMNRVEDLENASFSIQRWELRQKGLGESIDPHAFLRWLWTRDLQDRLAQEEGSDGVRLLTIHAAKGLEWDHVFVVGCNEDILPSRRGDIEEERRLFYVAVTRARERLYLSHLNQRESFGGKIQLLAPSRFLEVIK